MPASIGEGPLLERVSLINVSFNALSFLLSGFLGSVFYRHPFQKRGLGPVRRFRFIVHEEIPVADFSSCDFLFLERGMFQKGRGLSSSSSMVRSVISSLISSFHSGSGGRSLAGAALDSTPRSDFPSAPI